MKKIDIEKLRGLMGESAIEDIPEEYTDEFVENSLMTHLAEEFSEVANRVGVKPAMFVGLSVLWFDVGRRYGQQEIIDKTLENSEVK